MICPSTPIPHPYTFLIPLVLDGSWWFHWIYLMVYVMGERGSWVKTFSLFNICYGPMTLRPSVVLFVYKCSYMSILIRLHIFENIIFCKLRIYRTFAISNKTFGPVRVRYSERQLYLVQKLNYVINFRLAPRPKLPLQLF